MNQRDLLIRIDSEFQDKGFKSAEASARIMERELNRQEKAVRDLARAEFAAHRESEARRAAQLASMTKVGRGFTAMGVLAAAGLGIAAKAAMDWETAWAGVTKTTTGTAEQMGELEGQLRALTKVLPASHEEIAGVAEAAGQLGIRREDIAGFTKTMIDLGVSTNLSADEAATGIARISNVMGTLDREGTTGISRFGATLVALGNAGASTESEILDMAQRLSGAGKLVGASEADILALANAMSSMGIEAELGGGAIQRTFLKIYSAVRDGGDRLEGFAQIAGMSAQEFAQQWSGNPIAAFDAFIQGLDRVDKAGGNAVRTLGDVGIEGTQNLQVLLRLKGAGDLLSQSLTLGNDAWEKNLALVQEANKRYETSASRIAIARNNLNDAAIDIGGTVLPALAGAAARVGALASAFQSLPGPVKEGVTSLGGVAAALSTVGGLALLAIPKFKELNATLGSLGPRGAAAAKGFSSVGSALMGPWGLALGAATIALGIWAEKQYEAKKRGDELRATLDQQTGAITDQTVALVANRLEQDGILERYGDLSGGLKNLTETALGNVDATRKLRDEQRANDEALVRLTAQHGVLTDAILGTSDAIKSLQGDPDADAAEIRALQVKSTAYKQMFEALGVAGADLSEQTEAQKRLAEATGDTTTETADLGSGLGGMSKEAQQAADEVDKLTKSVVDYGETLADARDTNRAYEGAIDDAAKSLKDYRDGLIKHARAQKMSKADAEEWADAQIKAGKGIKDSTEAGRKNQDALDGIAKAAKEAAVANFENGMSVKDVSDKMATARGQFVDMATKMGMSSTKANALADDLGLTRQNVETLSTAVDNLPDSHQTKISADVEKALADVYTFKTALGKIHDRTIRYTFEGRLPNGGTSTKGGQTFGGGGYTGDISRTAPAGTVHGREFVSNADTTAQWRGLLEHMHAGGDPRAYLASASAASAPRSGPTTYNETEHRPVYVRVENLHASDVDDFTAKADAIAFAAAAGRNQ